MVSESAPPTTAASARPARALERDFGYFTRAFASRFFEPIAFPEEGAALLGRLSSKGELVHVMPAPSILCFLYLAWALLKRALPPLRAAIGLRWGFASPFRRMHQEGSAAQRVQRALEEGNSALIFFRQKTGHLPRLEPADDPFVALVQRARTATRPLYLVPELFIWQCRPRNVQPSLTDVILGTPESQSLFMTAVSFLANFRNAFMRVGEPIDLTAFVKENAADPDPVLVRKVRGALGAGLERDLKLIAGPPRKEPGRLIEETLRDRTLRATLSEVATETGLSPEALTEKARRHLEQIAARYRTGIIALSKQVLRVLFNRLHAGVQIDEPGLARALEAGRDSTLVFCPSHKSHLDYLLIAWVFAEKGMMCPLVAAGANLSFWPLGPFLRGGGAFFLRRSFKGDKVYTAAFRAYVKKIVREGYAHEFFPEGTRSRTGKLLSPRTGFLSFEIDAFLEGAQKDISFVPVAIDYETLLESKAYARELAGDEKKPESLRGLLAAPKALTSRYGRIYLNFEEPISLKQFLTDRLGPELKDFEGEARRTATRALAQRITFGISRALTVTPAALLAAALLADREGTVPAATLARRIDFLRALSRREQARSSPALEGASSDPSEKGPLNEMARTFMNDSLIAARVIGQETYYQVPPERRARLVFYKNNLVHLVAARSFIASALAACKGRASLAELRDRVRFLVQLLKLEFSFPVGKSFDALLNQQIDALVEEGLVARSGDTVAAGGARARELLAFLSDLTRDLCESYRLVLEVLPRAREAIERKELVKLAIERGRAQALEGRLRFQEAISKPNFENALALFVDQGVLVESAAGKRLALDPSHAEPDALKPFSDRLEELLR